MAKRRRIGEFPQNVIGDQRLPSRIVVNQRLDVLLQEVRSDCHLIVLVVEQANSMVLLVGYPAELRVKLDLQMFHQCAGWHYFCKSTCVDASGVISWPSY